MNHHHTGQKRPLTNAQRQARFRERRRLRENPPPDERTLDLFGGVSPSVTVAPGQPVTPAVTTEPVQVASEFVTPRYYSVALPSGAVPRVMGCPFCGCAPDVYQPEFSVYWVIQCRPCRCYVPRVEEPRSLSCVVVAWNTRGGRLGGAS